MAASIGRMIIAKHPRLSSVLRSEGFREVNCGSSSFCKWGAKLEREADSEGRRRIRQPTTTMGNKDTLGLNSNSSLSFALGGYLPLLIQSGKTSFCAEFWLSHRQNAALIPCRGCEVVIQSMLIGAYLSPPGHNCVVASQWKHDMVLHLRIYIN